MKKTAADSAELRAEMIKLFLEYAGCVGLQAIVGEPAETVDIVQRSFDVRLRDWLIGRRADIDREICCSTLTQ